MRLLKEQQSFSLSVAIQNSTVIIPHSKKVRKGSLVCEALQFMQKYKEG